MLLHTTGRMVACVSFLGALRTDLLMWYPQKEQRTFLNNWLQTTESLCVILSKRFSWKILRPPRLIRMIGDWIWGSGISQRNPGGWGSTDSSKGCMDNKLVHTLQLSLERNEGIPWPLCCSHRSSKALKALLTKPTSFPHPLTVPFDCLSKNCTLKSVKKPHLGRIFLKCDKRETRKWEDSLDERGKIHHVFRSRSFIQDYSLCVVHAMDTAMVINSLISY